MYLVFPFTFIVTVIVFFNVYSGVQKSVENYGQFVLTTYFSGGAPAPTARSYSPGMYLVAHQTYLKCTTIFSH